MAGAKQTYTISGVRIDTLSRAILLGNEIAADEKPNWDLTDAVKKQNLKIILYWAIKLISQDEIIPMLPGLRGAIKENQNTADGVIFDDRYCSVISPTGKVHF